MIFYTFKNKTLLQTKINHFRVSKYQNNDLPKRCLCNILIDLSIKNLRQNELKMQNSEPK